MQWFHRIDVQKVRKILDDNDRYQKPNNTKPYSIFLKSEAVIKLKVKQENCMTKERILQDRSPNIGWGLAYRLCSHISVLPVYLMWTWWQRMLKCHGMC